MVPRATLLREIFVIARTPELIGVYPITQKIRHCEERSDAAIQPNMTVSGLLRSGIRAWHLATARVPAWYWNLCSPNNHLKN